MSLGGDVVGPPPPDAGPGVCHPVPRSLQVHLQNGDCPTTNEPCRTTTVNGLTVLRSEATAAVAELGVDLYFGGIEADTITAVVATIIPSPMARVLAAGPVLDTTGWTRSSIANLQLVTPPSWRTHDLGNEPVPAACAGGVFEQHPQTLLTGKAVMPACPDRSYDEPPAVRVDGAWLYELIPGQGGIPLSDGPRFSTYPALGLRSRVGLANLDRTDTVTLYVVTSGANVIVTVGIGTDDTVARTIIHGLTLGRTPIGSLPRP